MNGVDFHGQKIYVEKFVPREDRRSVLFANSPENFKNLYVKNFSLSVDEEKLKSVFEVSFIVERLAFVCTRV